MSVSREHESAYYEPRLITDAFAARSESREALAVTIERRVLGLALVLAVLGLAGACGVFWLIEHMVSQAGFVL